MSALVFRAACHIVNCNNKNENFTLNKKTHIRRKLKFYLLNLVDGFFLRTPLISFLAMDFISAKTKNSVNNSTQKENHRFFVFIIFIMNTDIYKTKISGRIFVLIRHRKAKHKQIDY